MDLSSDMPLKYCDDSKSKASKWQPSLSLSFRRKAFSSPIRSATHPSIGRQTRDRRCLQTVWTRDSPSPAQPSWHPSWPNARTSALGGELQPEVVGTDDPDTLGT